jgi:hypothetical protein
MNEERNINVFCQLQRKNKFSWNILVLLSLETRKHEIYNGTY